MRPRVIRTPTIPRAALTLGIAMATGLAMHAGRAQDAPASVTIDVGDCVNLNSPGARFDCYERHVAAAKQPEATPVTAQPKAAPTAAAPTHADAVAIAPAAPASVPAAAAAAPAAVAAAVAVSATAPTTTQAAVTAAAPPQTVSTASAATPPPPAPAAKSAPALPEIVATVTELHETLPNTLQITLDNGQVWRQNIQQRYALKTGQRVTLRATKWGGSYRLSAESLNGFIQVERVR